MTVDYPDFMTEAQQMLAAYGGVTSQLQQLLTAAGMPLLHGYNELQTGTVITIPGASSAFTGADLQKIGYEIGLACSIASGAATNPWVEVQFTWQDASHANTICIENWYIPLSSTGTTFVFGKGPSKGPHVSIKVTNFDPAFTATVNMTLEESTHHIARDDWRCNYGSAVPTFTLLPSSDIFGLVLGGIGGGGLTLGAGLSKVYLMPLYCGQIQIVINMTAAANTQISIYALDPNLTNSMPIMNEQLSTLMPAARFANLPRTACSFTITNNSAAPNTYQFGIIPVEFAS